MDRNIIFLINPVSGTRRKESLRVLIEKKMTDSGIRFRIQPTEKSGDYSTLREQIEKEQITDIIICGGDGSVNQIVGSLLSTPVTFGIIPMGSGNGLALGAGIPIHTSRALDLVIQGKFYTIDAFRVNERFSCMLSGLGFDAQVAHDFASRKKRGLISYIKETVSHYFQCKPFPFVVDNGKKRIHTEAFFISIANSNQFGNRITIAPRASLSDGLLDVVIVNKMNKVKMALSVLWQIAMGKLMPESKDHEKRNIYYFHTSSLHIRNPMEAPLHIDGEPAETAQEISIQIIPGAFRLIMP
jgi:YegS/Rv2252/BmrU family lipid kinase